MSNSKVGEPNNNLTSRASDHPAFEIISETEAPYFPENWYDFATEDHFWVKWRHAVLCGQINVLEIPLDTPWRGLDIGCGQGIVQRQIEALTTWRVDGSDLNRLALERSQPGRGEKFLYNIHDRREEMREAFDFLVLFDVIEHIDEPVPFLEAALFHLKPEGLVFVNVPALSWLYSRYDRVAGHFRRYSKTSLQTELEACGARIVAIGYWGMSLIPLLILRKVLLNFSSRSDADIIRVGFQPPSLAIAKMLTALSSLETSVFRLTPIGSSVFAVARKPA